MSIESEREEYTRRARRQMLMIELIGWGIVLEACAITLLLALRS